MPTSTRTQAAPAAKVTKVPASRATTAKKTAPAPEPKPTEADVALQVHVKSAIAALKSVINYDNKRTEALKKYANIVCEIRKAMGDIAGTSQAYRDVVAKIYEGAGIPADSASTIQASIRYHIGNQLRTVFTPEELQAAGLSELTPLEKARAQREAANTANAAAATAAGEASDEEDEEGDEGEAAPVTPINQAAMASNPGVGPVFAGLPEGTKLPTGEVVLQAENAPLPAHIKTERRDYAERPRGALVEIPDPMTLVGHALDEVRAAASLPKIPATQAPSLRDMVRRMRLELDRLEARLAETSQTPRRGTRTRKAAS